MRLLLKAHNVPDVRCKNCGFRLRFDGTDIAARKKMSRAEDLWLARTTARVSRFGGLYCPVKLGQDDFAGGRTSPPSGIGWLK